MTKPKTQAKKTPAKKRPAAGVAINVDLQRFILETGSNPVTRELYLFGEVDGDMSFRFISLFREMDKYEGAITIHLNSTGGDEYEGGAIFETIRGANNPVTIEAIGSCQSIAALILQAAPYRRISPECRFMVHPGSITLGYTLEQNAFVALGDEIKCSHNKYVAALALRASKPYNKVFELCSKESYLSAKDAIEWGFADELIDTSQKYALGKKRSK